MLSRRTTRSFKAPAAAPAKREERGEHRPEHERVVAVHEIVGEVLDDEAREHREPEDAGGRRGGSRKLATNSRASKREHRDEDREPHAAQLQRDVEEHVVGVAAPRDARRRAG